MSYTKISPLGPKIGLGTLDTFCDKNKYEAIHQAILLNDCVVVDFMEEYRSKDIYAEAYHTKKPLEKHMVKLDKQFIKKFHKLNPDDNKMVEKICSQIFIQYLRNGN